MNSFNLTKWYLDACDNLGNLYIGYWAELNWLGIKIHYNQDLWKTSQANEIATNGGFTKVIKPVETEGIISWKKSKWKSLDNQIKEDIFNKTSTGKVMWECNQPKSLASINFPFISFKAYGYVEHIKLTIAPWELPLNTLYWGRCVTKNHYLVFIICEGAEEKNVYFIDGKRFENCKVETDKISGENFNLEINSKIIIRKGSLKENIFKNFKLMKKFPAVKTLLAEEIKWFAQGELEIDGVKEKVSFIYEKVEF